jgi:acetyl-CoA carboxylase alpha subunit
MAKDKKKEPAEPERPVEQRTAFERVQLARHSDRPYTLDLIERTATRDLLKTRQSFAGSLAFMACR